MCNSVANHRGFARIPDFAQSSRTIPIVRALSVQSACMGKASPITDTGAFDDGYFLGHTKVGEESARVQFARSPEIRGTTAIESTFSWKGRESYVRAMPICQSSKHPRWLVFVVSSPQIHAPKSRPGGRGESPEPWSRSDSGRDLDLQWQGFLYGLFP